MTNLFAGMTGEAELIFHDADYDIRKPGGYVLCAVTGEQIPLDELRYWSVDRQEAYRDAAASLKAHQSALA